MTEDELAEKKYEEERAEQHLQALRTEALYAQQTGQAERATHIAGLIAALGATSRPRQKRTRLRGEEA